MGNTLVKKSLLGVRLRTRFSRDPENAGGGGGAKDDVGGSTDDAGDDAADGEAGGDDDGDASTDKAPKTVSQAEYDRIKKHLSAADTKREAAEKKLRDLERKDLPELDKVQTELKDVTAERDTFRERWQTMARTNAFLLTSSTLKLNWVNANAALKLGDLDDLEIDADGTVAGIEDSLKKLAKDHPYLLAPASDEDTKDKGPTKSGSMVGSKTKGKKPEGEISDEELFKRFPALGR